MPNLSRVVMGLVAVVLACDRGEPAPKSEAGAAASARAEATKPDPGAAPVAATKETAEPAAAEAPPVALTRSQLAPGVEPPAKSDLLPLLREAGLYNPNLAAPPIGFGPRHYVVAVRTRGGTVAHYTLELAVARLSEGETPTWSLDPRRRMTLHEWKDEGWSENPGSIPTSLFVEDYDADGEAELMVRYRFEEMIGGGGLNTFTAMALVNLEGTELTKALQTLLHHTVTVYESKAKLSFEDLDNDGHPDLVINTIEYEEERQTEQSEERWRWDADSDRYVAMD